MSPSLSISLPEFCSPTRGGDSYFTGLETIDLPVTFSLVSIGSHVLYDKRQIPDLKNTTLVGMRALTFWNCQTGKLKEDNWSKGN